MLNYKVICIPFVLSLFISSTCFAQSFWGSGTQNAPAQTQPSSSGQNKVISPDEYNKMVNNLGQQNQNNLMQSAKTQLEKQAPAIQPLPQNNSSIPHANAPLNSQPPVAPAPVMPAPPRQTLPPPAPTSIVSPSPAAPAGTTQNQPYTGFGNFGNSGNSGSTTNTNSTNSNSGGWNIRY